MPLTQQFARVSSGYLDHCRRTGADPEVIALLDRAVSGDPGGEVSFLDHEEVYDGFGDPPRLLTPTAVTGIAAALDRVRLDDLLSELPTATEAAATACGFDAGFHGDVRAHLTRHFVAVREFHRAAARHAQSVVTWVD